MGTLTGLKYLYLNDNQLSEAIPDAWGSMTHLLPNLAHLSLHNNQLSGEIPADLGNLTSLMILHLYNNQTTNCNLTGRISVSTTTNCTGPSLTRGAPQPTPCPPWRISGSTITN